MEGLFQLDYQGKQIKQNNIDSLATLIHSEGTVVHEINSMINFGNPDDSSKEYASEQASRKESLHLDMVIE